PVEPVASVRVAVAEEVRRDHAVLTAELGDDLAPEKRPCRNAVQEEKRAALALVDERDLQRHIRESLEPDAPMHRPEPLVRRRVHATDIPPSTASVAPVT